MWLQSYRSRYWSHLNNQIRWSFVLFCFFAYMPDTSTYLYVAIFFSRVDWTSYILARGSKRQEVKTSSVFKGPLIWNWRSIVSIVIHLVKTVTGQFRFKLVKEQLHISMEGVMSNDKVTKTTPNHLYFLLPCPSTLDRADPV